MLHAPARRILARRVSTAGLKDWLLSRRPVGKDSVATFYESKDGGPNGVRRTFELHDGEAEPTDISPEWLSWLRGTRAAPPTAEEAAHIARQREQVQLNAAARARAEVLRRERASVLSRDAAAGPADALGEADGSAGRSAGAGFAPDCGAD